jgi:hypothetical protein
MSIVRYITYSTTTGEVKRASSASASAYANLPTTSPAGQDRYIGDLGGSGFNRYMPNGIPTDRPRMTLSTNVLITTGVPSGASVTVTDSDFNEATYTVDDGEIDFTGSSSGTYKVLIENFPHIPEQYEVTV